MKRYVLIAISLLFVVGLITAVFAGVRKRVQPVVKLGFNKLDFPEHGVHLIIPTDTGFDDTARKHFKYRSPEDLKPFSVFIHNSGPRKVMAYALTWKLVRKDGQVITKTVGYSEPDLFMGKEEVKAPGYKHTVAIEPDNARCFTLESKIDPDLDDVPPANAASHVSVFAVKGSAVDLQNDAARLKEQLAAQLTELSDITVSLDGVVFDDGIFIGSNQIFFQQLQATINAKVDLLQELAKGVEEHKTDQALASIEAASQEPEVTFSREFSADEYYRFYRKLYAGEIIGMTRTFGKIRALPHFLNWHHADRPILRKG
jgi:hypothetical protein